MAALLVFLMGQAEAGVCWVGPVPAAGKSRITYMDGAEAIEAEQERARIELRTPMPTPVNGWVLLHIERIDIEYANAANQIVAIESGGQQVLRYEPEADVPGRPAGMYGMWQTMIAVPVPDEAVFPITVHAVDRMRQHRCSWLVTEKGKVKDLQPTR